jgi:hypothetical protein
LESSKLLIRRGRHFIVLTYIERGRDEDESIVLGAETTS